LFDSSQFITMGWHRRIQFHELDEEIAFGIETAGNSRRRCLGVGVFEQVGQGVRRFRRACFFSWHPLIVPVSDKIVVIFLKRSDL
jgi:hypothetical protein